MPQKIWRAVVGRPFEVMVRSEDQGAVGFGQYATRDGEVVDPTDISPPSLSEVTWTYPAFEGPTKVAVTFSLLAASGGQAQIYVEVRQNGQVLACQYLSSEPPINGPPGGPFDGVDEGTVDVLASRKFSLVVRKKTP